MRGSFIYGFLFLFILIQESYSQQNVGIGTNSPNPSAALDIVASDKGVLIPRVQASQRLLISPVDGLMVYDTDSSSLFIYENTAWKRLRSVTSLSSLISGVNPNDVLVWNGTNWVVTPKCSLFTYFFRDEDGDGKGDKYRPVYGCTPLPGFVADSTDCNDTNPLIYGGAVELCNGIDDDCDGLTDEGCVNVIVTGIGTGTVSSSPAGINCPGDCNDPFPVSTAVTLTAAPAAGSVFAGWTGACSGTGTCVVTTGNSPQNVTATFDIQQFALTVTRSGPGSGSVTSAPAGINCGTDCSETYDYGTMVTLTATPNAGSTFAGWSGGGCSGTGTCVVTMDAAKTVNANFAVQQFTLDVLKAGTGTGTVTSTPAGINCGSTCSGVYNYGSTVILTAIPDAGSTFTGWSGGGCSGTGSCVVTIDAAKIVTANFTAIPYNLTINKTGSGTVTSSPAGINCGADCSEAYSSGTVVTLTATPDAGASFLGWTGACAGTGSCVLTMDAAKTVAATFSQLQFTLTVSKSGAGTGTVSSAPAGISCGADCNESYNSGTMVTLTATPGAGSTFTGWSGACSGTGSCVVSMDAAKSVTANFSKQQFSLTVSKSGAGIGTVTSVPAGITCGADCSETYDYGTMVTLTASPNAGSTFTGWSGGGCSGTGTCIVTMDAAKTVTANFGVQQFSLDVLKAGTGTGTVTSAPAGISCGADCSESYNSGTMVTLTATPGAGSTFTGWSGACSGTGSCVVTMDAARSVTANFALQQFTLTISKTGTGTGTVTSAPAGISCGADCSESYNSGTMVTLTATPGASSTFTGWSGACSGTGSCVVTMDAAKSVTANFALQQLTLSVQNIGTASGTVTSTPSGISCGSDCSETYNYGTVVTLTATPDAGASFLGWTGACTGTGSCVVTMDAAKSVTANYALQQFTLTVSKTGTGTGTVTSTPAGITCGADCSELYNYSTVVTLTATPDGSSTFTGWSGACTGTGSCVLTMDAAKSVTANFTNSNPEPSPVALLRKPEYFEKEFIIPSNKYLTFLPMERPQLRPNP